MENSETLFLKSNNFENITLVENEEVISDEKEVAEVFSKYFDMLVSNLNLKVSENLLSPHENLLSPHGNIDNPICAAVSKYQNHPSIKIIWTKHRNKTFSFDNVIFDCINYEIKNLDPHKVIQESDIQTKIIK